MEAQEVHEGQLLRRIIDESGMSMAEFARRAGLNRKTLYNQFESEVVPRRYHDQIARVIGYNPFSQAVGVGFVKIPTVRIEVDPTVGESKTTTLEAIGIRSFKPEYVDERGVDIGRSFCVEILDESMSPYICRGDTVAVDGSKTAPTGRKALFLVKIQWTIMAKWLRRTPDGIEVVSENPEYPPETIPNEGRADFAVIGWIWDIQRKAPKP